MFCQCCHIETGLRIQVKGGTLKPSFLDVQNVLGALGLTMKTFDRSTIRNMSKGIQKKNIILGQISIANALFHLNKAYDHLIDCVRKFYAPRFKGGGHCRAVF